MTAATITEYVNVPLSMIEVVRLTASDAETFVSRKFSTIAGAVINQNWDEDSIDLNVTFSGATATINGASVTDKLMTLILFGQH